MVNHYNHMRTIIPAVLVDYYHLAQGRRGNSKGANTPWNRALLCDIMEWVWRL